MKNGSLRKSMTWLHTWIGLVFCWIMYYMFVTGTVGYFDEEIDHWMEADTLMQSPISLGKSLGLSYEFLAKKAPEAEQWFLFPSQPRRPLPSAAWRGQPIEGSEELDSGNEKLNTDSGEPTEHIVRDTGGGQRLYKMHYRFHYMDRALYTYLSIVVTLVMFIAVVSGVVIHRKIFIDFFTFRQFRGAKSWLDFHNILSVSSLPFQLMITYSGLIFMVTSFFPLIAIGSYGFDKDTVRKELSILGGGEVVERANVSAKMIDVETLIKKVLEHAQDQQLRNIRIQAPNDQNATIIINTTSDLSNNNGQRIILNGVTGALISSEQKSSSSGLSFAYVLLGLHEGLFAGIGMRWLYFIAGVVGSGMIATGAIYYVEKRKVKLQENGKSKGFKFIENMNIGTIVGLIAAISAYFIANRLLPLDMEARANWEVHCMFLTWAVFIIHPFIRPIKKAWSEQLIATAVLLFCIPIVNFFTSQIHLINTVINNNWALAAIDLFAIFLGVILILTARFYKKRNAV